MNRRKILIISSLLSFLLLRITFGQNYIVDGVPPVTTIDPYWHNWTISNISFLLICKDPSIIIRSSSGTVILPGTGCNRSFYIVVPFESFCPNPSFVKYLNATFLKSYEDSIISSGNVSCETSVCISKVCFYSIDNSDNIEKVKNSSSYCIDKKPPYFVNIEHYPELTSYADNTYDPYPNFYYDMNGIQRQLTPDKVVIDKEYISISVQSRDEYNGKEISGVAYSSVRFNVSNESTKSQKFQVGSCPNGGLYIPPATLNAIFGNLNISWGGVSAYTQDQAGLSASNNNYKVYIFLGARGDQQNQMGTDKIVFLKTYWDSSNEVQSRTQNLGGKYSKKINCFGYSNKCTQIRDIIGKTDEFTDCLWVGPSNNPRNVRIYNFKQAIDLESNTLLNPMYYKDFGNRVVFAWENIAPVNNKIAFCSKNDTGILIDLPNLISRDIKNGFEFLPSTEKRFSVIWQVEYAREQREVAVECYLNPTNDGYNACTINDILNGNCQLESGQKCKCGNAFPCIQDTRTQTIQSCSVENPKYFTGKNRIICRFYDPRDKGVRAEVWFNHDFYYLNGKLMVSSKLNIIDYLKYFIANNFGKVKILFKASET